MKKYYCGIANTYCVTVTRLKEENAELKQSLSYVKETVLELSVVLGFRETDLDILRNDNAILQKRIKALEANVSKSVLRRLDVQFAGQFTGGTVPTYFSEQDREE